MTGIHGVVNLMVIDSELFTIQSCTDAMVWDEFVAKIPWATPQHYFSWGQTLDRCFGYLQQVYRLFYLKGIIVAALPIIRFSASFPFKASYSLSFNSYGGPLIHPDYMDNNELFSKVVDEIHIEANQHKAFEVRFSLPPMIPNEIVQKLNKNHNTISISQSSYVLNLKGPLEVIEKKYKASVHRAIRRSINAGVTVDIDADLETIRKAYPIYLSTMKRLKGTAKPFRFIEKLMRKKLAVGFVARINRKIVGIVILLVSPLYAIYWISAAEVSFSSYRPTNALVYHAIRWCHWQGISMFDFGESLEEQPGLVRFKKGWGPVYKKINRTTFIYRPRIRQSWLFLEPIARKAYVLWDFLWN
jgi:Acetyltransferase (GNAT) domain